MNPTNSNQGGDALGPNTPQSPQDTPTATPQAAAANVIRSQIDALYGDRPVAPVASREEAVPYVTERSAPAISSTPSVKNSPNYYGAGGSAATDDNPYNRTHTPNPEPQADQWKAYHSAWQNYYQKYYEAYYHQRDAQQAQVQAQLQSSAQAPEQSAQPVYDSPAESDAAEITKDQALFELRQKLLGKVRHQASKIRGSKHFIPITAALCVVLLFVFLQYNRVILATVSAYVSPGAVDPQNIVIDPSANNQVSADPRLIIPKINVDVPVIYNVGLDHASQMDAMARGVAHFAIPGANSHPGEVGNTVFSGHSSNDLFDRGDYKFIFAQLEKLTTGDTIYVHYEGKRYTYVVTKQEVVKPTQVDALIYPTTKPVLTLITCTPLGTALNRLLITAEQISPDPASATAAPSGSGTASGESEAIPGNSPTLLERLFGAN